MDPKITVYITNYNYGKYIDKAIKSVLKQSEQNFELIIIDDGSTDESKSIIEKYALHDKIKVVYQKNKGLNISNNIALKIAKGKYIIRLDADDYFHKDALKYLSIELDNDYKVGLVFPNYYIVDSDDNIISEIKRHNFNKEVTLYDQPAHGACTMIRVEYLKSVGGYDESFSCQDGYDLWIKFISNYKIRNVERSLFYYRQHGANLTKNENRLLETRIKMKKKFIKLKNKILPKTIGIIPVRSLHISNLCFEKVDDKTLIERVIESALNTELLEKIVIAFSDKRVFDFIKLKFNDKRIILLERPKNFSRYNSSLYNTVKLIFDDEEVSRIKPESFVLLDLEYPFIKPNMIDNSIHTAVIFEADTVISTRLDTCSHYKHNGSTMIPIFNESLTKYERDDLFVAKGGIVYSTFANMLRNKKLPSGKTSHIIVDQISAFKISTTIDLKIANCLSSLQDPEAVSCVNQK